MAYKDKELKLISCMLDPETFRKLDQLWRACGYSSRTRFVRDVFKNTIDALYRSAYGDPEPVDKTDFAEAFGGNPESEDELRKK